MLTLYHSTQTRSTRFLWLLEEIGAPYAVKYVGIRRGDGTGETDPANIHPYGKVPALLDSEALITESAAIALYLSDAYPAAKLGPAVGDPKRGEYLTWLFFYAAEMEPTMMARMTGHGEEPIHAKAYDQMVDRISKALHVGPYLLGEAFSTADVLYGSAMQWMRNQFPDDPVYDRYLERLAARPAMQRGQIKDAA